MKKTLLWGTLIALICTQAHSDATQQTNPVQQPDAATSNNNQGNTTPTTGTTPSTATPQQNPNSEQMQPSTQQSNTNTTTGTAQQNTTNQQQPTTNQANQQNQATPQSTTTQTPTPQTPPVIDCNYKIPADTKTIDQTLLLTWSQAATTQAFDFNPDSLDAQMQKLQACFTDQGWLGFNSALQKSGNIEAIKTQKLHVSSQIDGQALITDSQDGQWKVNVPLQVVYQNDKEKVTQLLTVSLTIGRKKTGDLGINQMIATPRTASAAQQNTTGNPSGAPNTATPSNTPTNGTGQTNTSSTDPTVNTTTNSGTPNTTTQGQ
ncbi:DotI/IcmL family type IV secretion protein [Legionella waltersii]|uniref:IcmL-like protein n=1 Tax=Legionella waltersii TaxID=66969 RepID=A0A0W1A093_9GAMM|nr:DotI/IcmL family type IV secretion protein [Legionella waltersii]KTD74780.1 IcmL-like protein [Legionella waltersii]SNV00426.1 IcmL-like protein [Legionella waltersii]